MKSTTYMIARFDVLAIPVNIGLSKNYPRRTRTRWTVSASRAARFVADPLAETATANQILVGPETVRRLGNCYQLERFDREILKNRAEASSIYRLLGPVCAKGSRLFSRYEHFVQSVCTPSW